MEDFSAFVKVDPQAFLVVSPNEIEIINASRDLDAFSYKPYGLDYFQNFGHTFSIEIKSGTTGAVNLWQLSNEVGNGMIQALRLMVYESGGTKLLLGEGVGWCVGNRVLSEFTLEKDREYFVTLKREGTSLTCQVFEDVERTVLIGNLALNVASTRYCNLYPFATVNTGVAGYSWSGYVHNLVISTGEAPQPEPTGTGKAEMRAIFIQCEGYGISTDWQLIAEHCKQYNIDRVYMEIAGFQGTFADVSTPANAGDMLTPALDAFHSNGIEVHVSWNILHSPSDEQIDMWCIDENGNPSRWACPSNPDVRDWLISRIQELLLVYDVDGFMYDYLRYKDGVTCYCQHCKAAFEQHLGETFTDQDFRSVFGSAGARRNEFMEWRTIPITELTRDISALIRSLKPDVEISLASWTLGFGAAHYWRYWMGQDTARYVDLGYLDAVLPMMYSSELATEEAYLTADSDLFTGGIKGKIPLYPLLMMDYSGRYNTCTPDKVKAIIERFRQLGVSGWALWRYGGQGYPRPNTDISEVLNIVALPSTFKMSNLLWIKAGSDLTVTWNTNVPTTSKLEYSENPLYVAMIRQQSGINYFDKRILLPSRKHLERRQR